MVQETLATAIPVIFEILGPFATDAEVKSLLKSFFTNLDVDSAVKRRSTARCIVGIAINSRSTYDVIEWLLRGLISTVAT